MDTTVILAQPRVSRLRAAAKNVLHRAAPSCAEHGRASAEIDRKHSGEFFQGPPKSLQICPCYIPKQAEKVPKSDLKHGQIFRPKSVPVIYRNNSLICGGGRRAIGFGTQNWPQIHQNFDFF